MDGWEVQRREESERCRGDGGSRVGEEAYVCVVFACTISKLSKDDRMYDLEDLLNEMDRDIEIVSSGS